MLKSTKVMGVTKAVSIIKGPKDEPIKSFLLSVNEGGERINKFSINKK